MKSNRAIHIIAIQENYLEEITKQMKDVLGHEIMIRPTALKELRANMVHDDDIVVLSHHMIKGLVSQLIPADCPCIIAKRDVNFANARELINLPPGQKILVVNDTKTNIEETVASLRETIFEHEYYPYNPDESIPDSIDYILTPGELDFLPTGLIDVINIGSRLLDIETFYDIATALGLKNDQTQIVKRYFKTLVSLSTEYDEGKRSAKTNPIKDIRNVSSYSFQDVIAVSESMQKVVQLGKEFAKTPLPVHLYGEDGTGKSMLAQAIHHHSCQSGNPFISINCKSKSTDMLERELFGSEESHMISIGAFEVAENGTVYLEDADELLIPLQNRIFRAIKEKKFHRVGGTKSIPFQARLISCSKQGLIWQTESGEFNHSFYEALTSLSLKVPSLKDRREDFVALIEDIKGRLKKTDIILNQDVMNQLLNYEWPGNVTELYNTITYLSFLGEQTIEVELLPLRIRIEESNFQPLPLSEINPNEAIRKIEAHGFLEESVEILRIFEGGKRERTSYGRLTLKKHLEEKGINLTEQQLRMRMEVLQELDLLIVRQGRAGSTISQNGEEFLRFISNSILENSKR
ncbi:sigma 54-interacting transcriptional regulator [Neobacillus sp. NPDC058068]|uniref:sigma 54-interacting transcriptional regulator n=1 Tax=Neobacillus sp. NPDC058068 TaxID=3346325 RepID=UPI0036DC06CC